MRQAKTYAPAHANTVSARRQFVSARHSGIGECVSGFAHCDFGA
jgi:hypothetical protein